MVKNATGGSKTKGQGRKFVTAKPSNKLRVSEDPCEVYSQVIKTLGNGMVAMAKKKLGLIICQSRATSLNQVETTRQI